MPSDKPWLNKNIYDYAVLSHGTAFFCLQSDFSEQLFVVLTKYLKQCSVLCIMSYEKYIWRCTLWQKHRLLLLVKKMVF